MSARAGKGSLVSKKIANLNSETAKTLSKASRIARSNKKASSAGNLDSF